MPSALKASPPIALAWPPILLAAGITIGGALAMTVVLGAVAMLASAVRGFPPAQVPLVLTADPSFAFFCAAAGVFTALAAGYITARANQGAIVRHGLASAALAVAGHIATVSVLGSPLEPLATAVYIALIAPAVCVGCYFGSPANSRQRAAAEA